MNIWALFIILQFLDVLTTVVFLMIGAQEGMWVTRWLMGHLGSWLGLLVSKLLILSFLIIAYWKKEKRIVVMANYFYLGIPAWNSLVTIITLTQKT